MEKLCAALLLLNLTKDENTILILLYFLFKKHGPTKDKRKYTIKEIASFAGLSETKTLDVLNRLSDRNILGKVVYEEKLLNREIVKEFSDDFKKTFLKAPENYLTAAIDRIGFYIDNDADVAFVINHIRRTWKYPAGSKVKKAIKPLKGLIKDSLFDNLESSIKKGRKSANQSVNGWSIYQAVESFKAKYKHEYDAIYSVNQARDFKHMKTALSQLSDNKVQQDKLDDFFDYAFKEAKRKKAVLQIASLKYYANVFVANVTKSKEESSEYYRTDEGKLRRKRPRKNFKAWIDSKR